MIEVILEQIITRAAGPAVQLTGAEQAARVTSEPAAPAVRHVVVLREKDGPRRLPIWIGPHEADLLAMRLAGQTAPRPLTFDLIVNLLQAAGSQVTQVCLVREQAGIFYAEVRLQTGGQAQAVDARPSDALNLALRAGVPILAADGLLEAHGVPADGLEAALAEPAAGTAHFTWNSQSEPAE